MLRRWYTGIGIYHTSKRPTQYLPKYLVDLFVQVCEIGSCRSTQLYCSSAKRTVAALKTRGEALYYLRTRAARAYRSMAFAWGAKQSPRARGNLLSCLAPSAGRPVAQKSDGGFRGAGPGNMYYTMLEENDEDGLEISQDETTSITWTQDDPALHSRSVWSRDKPTSGRVEMYSDSFVAFQFPRKHEREQAAKRVRSRGRDVRD